MASLYELSARLTLEASEFIDALRDAINETDELTAAADRASDANEEISNSADNAAPSVEELGSQLSNASDSGESMSGSVDNAAESLSKFALKAAGTIGAVAVTGKIAQFMWEATEGAAAFGDAIDKNSQKIGISSQGYQKWSNILEHTGSNISVLQGVMRILTQNANEGDSAFERLGMSIDEVRQMTSEELFEKTIAGLQNVASSSERAELASSLLGKSYMELNPLLNMSNSATAELVSNYNRLASAMSDVQVANAAAFTDAKTDLSTAWQGFQNQVGSLFLPAATEVINFATEGLSAINRAIAASYPEAQGGSLEDMQAILQNLQQQREEVVALQETINNDDKVTAMQYELMQIDSQIAAQEAAIEKARVEYAKAEAERQAAYERMLSGLAANYSETYANIEKSVKSYFGTFDEVSAATVGDIDQMVTALQSQVAWNQRYQGALQTITAYSDEYGISMNEVNVALANAGESGASYALAIADAIENGDSDKVMELVEAFEELTSSQDELAMVLTDATGAFDELYAAANGDIEKIKKALSSLDGTTVHIQAVVDYYDPGYTPKGTYSGGAGRAGGEPYIYEHNTMRMLHEGERILTKEENEEYTKGGGKNVTVNIYPQSMSQSEIDYITDSINRNLGGALR